MLKLNHRILGVSAFLAFVIVLCAGDVRACLCPVVSAKARVKLMRKEADAIFVGVVESVEAVSPTSLKVTLSVKRSWTSDAATEYAVYTGDGGCSINFVKGSSFLVYAKKDENGRLVTSLCYGTRVVERAGKDLKLLGRERRKKELSTDKRR